MKRPIALFASILFILILTATLGIAQANPNTPSTTDATPTETGTATATTTTDPCSVRPPGPNLIGPPDGSTLNKTQIKLRWSSVPCAFKYRILVRRGSKNGTPVQRGATNKLKTVTGSLSRGYWYYWNIKACVAGQGCTRSETRTFRIPPGNTPVPQTPGPTGQPTTQPNGTPVPGVPPSNLVNYNSPDRGGTGVYLNNDNTYLYRYECGKDQGLWGHYPIGSTVFNVALWYYANERITYQRLDFNTTQIVETKTLSANGSGYVSYNVDTSSWTPNHHYHLIFKGQSSSVSWCGHFDIQTNGEIAPVPHTDADVERVYRAAGLEQP